MKILITGTDGFIGSHLKDYFSNTHEVTGTVFFRAPGSDEINFNIESQSDFKNLPVNPDIVIHTAGLVEQTLPRKKLFSVNAQGTRNLVLWSEKNSSHFIFTSSITVYGAKLLGINRSEKDTKRSCSTLFLPYGHSKVLAEEFIEKSSKSYTILRLPAVFGENDSYLSAAIIPGLLNGTFSFFGKKDRLYSTMYVKNLGPIIESIIEKGPFNRAFNCCDYHITWKEFISEFAKSLDVKMPDKRQSLLNALPRIRDKRYMLMVLFSYFGAHYPNSELFKSIGFKPRLPWQQGVKEACKKYLHHLPS